MSSSQAHRTATVRRATSSPRWRSPSTSTAPGVARCPPASASTTTCCSSLAKHSLIDLTVHAGVMSTWTPTTVEDVAIVLGQAPQEGVGRQAASHGSATRWCLSTRPWRRLSSTWQADPMWSTRGEPAGQEYVIVGGTFVGSLTRHVWSPGHERRPGPARPGGQRSRSPPRHRAQFKAVARAFGPPWPGTPGSRACPAPRVPSEAATLATPGAGHGLVLVRGSARPPRAGCAVGSSPSRLWTCPAGPASAWSRTALGPSRPTTVASGARRPSDPVGTTAFARPLRRRRLCRGHRCNHGVGAPSNDGWCGSPARACVALRTCPLPTGMIAGIAGVSPGVTPRRWRRSSVARPAPRWTGWSSCSRCSVSRGGPAAQRPRSGTRSHRAGPQGSAVLRPPHDYDHGDERQEER